MHYKNISIRKKILLSNLLMVFIPIVFVCLILFIILAGFTFFTSNSSIMVRNVLLNSSNYGPTLLLKQLDDEIASQDTLHKSTYSILHKLEDLGVQLYITKNNETYYVSEAASKESVEKEFQKVAQTKQYEVPYIVWNQHGMAYASSLTNANKDTFVIRFASEDLRLPKGTYASWEQTKLVIKLIILSAGIIIILIIVALGAYLTRKLSRHILQPLRQLQLASDDIRQGHLSTPLSSTTQDEIGELFENFEAMREALAHSYEVQNHYEENRKELIAGISHDLNTPLTAIQGYVNGLMDGIANTPEKQQHYLETIQEQTSKMADLVESLFLFSKLDLGKEPFDYISLDFKDFLFEWILAHRATYQDQSLTIDFQCQETYVPVTIDPMQFTRVLTNLLNNAMKYKVRTEVIVTITLWMEDKNCFLSVQDDGDGIKEEEASFVFDSFYRSDPARSSTIKGHGLGLAIAKQIVEHAGGTIQAIQKPAQGLCILITLPLEDEL